MRAFLLFLTGAQAGLLRSALLSKPSVERAIELLATKSKGRPDECFDAAWEDVPYCRTWPNLPMGMPSYCKQTMMYEKDYVTGKVNGPEECISFERPDNCDFHSYCHYCMVYKPEYGLLSKKDQGASYEKCKECCLEGCCSYYATYGCEDKCEERKAEYGAECEAICANNALEHLDSPLERMLTKKRKFTAPGYTDEAADFER